MPIYEYECADCGHEFEFLVSGSEAKPECPKCRSIEVKKLFSAFGFKSGGRVVSSSGGCSSCSSSSCGTCGPN